MLSRWSERTGYIVCMCPLDRAGDLRIMLHDPWGADASGRIRPFGVTLSEPVGPIGTQDLLATPEATQAAINQEDELMNKSSIDDKC